MMHLHAYTDGSGFWNYGYYIVETEERCRIAHPKAITSTAAELLGMLELLRSQTALRADHLTVFCDNAEVVRAARHSSVAFRKITLDGIRVAIREALLLLPYKPSIFWIQGSYNLAHGVIENRDLSLSSDVRGRKTAGITQIPPTPTSKTQLKKDMNVLRRADGLPPIQSSDDFNESKALYSHYLKAQQLGIK